MIYCVFDGVAYKPVVSFSAENDDDAIRFVKRSFASSPSEAVDGLRLFRLGKMFCDYKSAVEFELDFGWVADLKVLVPSYDQFSVNVQESVRDHVLPTLTEFERLISNMAARIDRLEFSLPARWVKKSLKSKGHPLNL